MQNIYHLLLFVTLCAILPGITMAQTGEELFDIGSAYFDNSSFQEAITTWERAMQVDPTLAANSWYNIGLAYAGMEKYTEAIDAWDKTISLAPDSPIAYDNKGTALAILGRYDEALAQYDIAIQLDPENMKFKGDREMLIESMKTTKSPISPATILFGIIAGVGCLLLARQRT